MFNMRVVCRPRPVRHWVVEEQKTENGEWEDYSVALYSEEEAISYAQEWSAQLTAPVVVWEAIPDTLKDIGP